MKTDTDLETKRIITAAYLYSKGLSQDEIGKRMGISPPSVSRLIKRSRGYVNVTYNVPQDIHLAAKIIGDFDLQDAVIVEGGPREVERQIVGEAAARYFMSVVENGQKVGISCGGTLRELAGALPVMRQMDLSLAQLTVESDPTALDEAPATLVGMLKAKMGLRSDVYGLQLPPFTGTDVEKHYRAWIAESEIVCELRNRALSCDAYFVGIGLVDFEKRLDNAFGHMAAAATGGRFNQWVRKLGLVGEINNEVFDQSGVGRNDDIPGFGENCINLVRLREFSKLSQEKGKRIVGVAAGVAKVAAIRVAIESKFVNSLVTSVEVAERLLDRE